MTQDEYLAAKRVITEQHAEMMAWPVEKLRAHLEQSQREIEDGWLGISDWLLSKQGQHP